MTVCRCWENPSASPRHLKAVFLPLDAPLTPIHFPFAAFRQSQAFTARALGRHRPSKIWSHENINGVFFTQLHRERTISTCSVLLNNATQFHFNGVSNLTKYVSMDGCGEVFLFFTGGLLGILQYRLVAEITSRPGGGVQYAHVRAGRFFGAWGLPRHLPLN